MDGCISTICYGLSFCNRRHITALLSKEAFFHLKLVILGISQFTAKQTFSFLPFLLATAAHAHLNLLSPFLSRQQQEFRRWPGGCSLEIRRFQVILCFARVNCVVEVVSVTNLSMFPHFKSDQIEYQSLL